MTIADDITRLVKPSSPANRLPGLVTPTTLRAKTGLSTPSGRGVAPPLTEVDADTRTYYSPASGPSPHSITSTDGIFTIEYFPIKSIDLIDGDGNALPIGFDEPTP